ncbi:neutral zinc metallopeptidase [Actinoplanes sp. NPDC051851]|uniref:neutral zinc metallopeptidase n=1 Tax=Actinoplanes sp. NPDC051851 TaxID=3154753 RepID=UPI003430EEC8
MSARRLTVLSILLLTLVACGGGPLVDGEEPTAEPTVTATGSLNPDGTDSPEEFAADMKDAQEVAEDYWSQIFERAGTRFQPISQVVPYEREGEVDCAGEALPLNNAVYCSDGDFIAYDVNWAFDVFRQIGDSFLFYLLAHEYAHGIQARLGIQKRFTIQQELQADCMAGAFIGDEQRAGALVLQEGDTEELARGLESVGDDPGQPWFAEGAHGSAEQRTESFEQGFNDSLTPCKL